MTPGNDQRVAGAHRKAVGERGRELLPGGDLAARQASAEGAVTIGGHGRIISPQGRSVHPSARRVVRAQIEAEELARKRKHVQAVQVLTLLCDDLEVRGHAAVARACKEVAEAVAGEAEFEGSKAYRASMRKGLGRDAAVMYEQKAVATLYQMGLDRSTAAQEKMAGSFKRGEGTGGEAKRAAKPADAPSGVRRKRSRRW
jgi:hypothetical protein